MTGTVHVLHAGDGYDYLTRQVAVGDRQLEAGQSITDYYAARGEPPGRWLGSGIEALGVSGLVREDQMAALFGEGLHPEAETIIAAAVAAGATPGAAVESARLGRRFPTYSNDTRFNRALSVAYAEHRKDTGRHTDAWGRAGIRARVGQEVYAAEVGQAPDERQLGRYLAEQRRLERQPVAGYDLVYTPVKSVSVLWAVGSDDVRRVVEDVHADAVGQVVGFLEEHAAFTRRGAGGVAQVPTGGLVITAFDHRTSRAGDPNLHTHLAVANRVQAADGAWLSVDGRMVHQTGVAASELYNTAIEDGLRARLGVAFEERDAGRGKRPVREVVGVPAELTARFSQRRSAITAAYTDRVADYRVAHGHEPSRAVQYKLGQEATLATRPAKVDGRSLAELRTEWRATAVEVLGEPGLAEALDAAVPGGRDIDTPAPAAGRAVSEVGVSGAGVGEPEPVPATAVDPAEVGRGVVDTVSEQRSTWNMWHVRAEAERTLRGVPIASTGNRRELVAQVTAAALGPGCSLRLSVDDPVPAALQRPDGSSVLRMHGTGVYTSEPVLAAEARLVAAARTPSTDGVSEATLAAGVAVAEHRAGRELDTGQRALVRHFTTAGRDLAVGIGPAGAGKTTAMRAVAQVWRLGGGRVIGLAPSARAAVELGQEVGITANTIDSVTVRYRHGVLGDSAVRAGDMLLVDEAGMASTRNLDRLREIAAERGAVLRLLGDPQQLAAVEAGGALRLLAGEVGAAQLDTVHRFTDPGEAAASLALRAGTPAAAGWYVQHGRVHGGEPADLTNRVYAAWRADTNAGRQSMMIAAEGDTVTALNDRARTDRVTAGQVAPDGVRLHTGSVAGVGDVVVTRRNDRELRTAGRATDWVRNGDLWTVRTVEADGGLRVHSPVRGGVSLPAEYVHADVELGYAATVHRAQGMTVDTSHAQVGEHTGREQLYVAATRGRDANHLYLPTDHLLDVDAAHPPERGRDLRDALARIIAREAAERSATETIRDQLEAPQRLDTLVAGYRYAAELLDPRPPIDVPEVVRAALPTPTAQQVLADAALPALAEQLRFTRAAGQDTTDTLRAAAEGPAQVLTQRLHPTDHPGRPQGPLPWLPPPTPAPDPDRPDLVELAAWQQQVADRIQARVGELGDELADTPATGRQPWTASLGDPPTDLHRRTEWTAQAGIVAAYREQHAITDPDRPVGDHDTHHPAAAAALGAVDAAARLAAGPATTPPATPEVEEVLTALRRAWDAQQQAHDDLEALRRRLPRAEATAAARQRANNVLAPLQTTAEQTTAAAAAAEQRLADSERTVAAAAGQLAAQLRAAWDAEQPAVQAAADTLAAGPGRLHLHGRAVRDAQRTLQDWGSRWEAVDPQITRRSGPNREYGGPADYVRRHHPLYGEPIQPRIDSYARTLAETNHPGHADHQRAADTARAAAEAAAAELHRTRTRLLTEPGLSGVPYHNTETATPAALTHAITDTTGRLEDAQHAITAAQARLAATGHPNPAAVTTHAHDQWTHDRHTARLAAQQAQAARAKADRDHYLHHPPPNYQPHHDIGPSLGR